MRLLNARNLRTVIVLLMVAGVIALALGGYLAPITRITINPLVNIQTWLANRYTAISEFITAPRDVATLRQRNLELESEVANLQAQVIELQQQNTEIQILTALLDFARANPTNEYLAANVIGRIPSPFLQYVFINRGSDDGIRSGMPVVSSQGLIGRVAAVSSNASRIQLITDPAVSINTRLQNADVDAVLHGSITGDINLEMIPPEITIEPGDLVLTSGLGGNYPPNILIGQISSVRSRSFDLFQTAAVQSVVDFTQLDIILVISNFRAVDITPLIPQDSP